MYFCLIIDWESHRYNQQVGISECQLSPVVKQTMLCYKSIHAASQDYGSLSLNWMESGYTIRVAALFLYETPVDRPKERPQDPDRGNK